MNRTWDRSVTTGPVQRSIRGSRTSRSPGAVPKSISPRTLTTVVCRSPLAGAPTENNSVSCRRSFPGPSSGGEYAICRPGSYKSSTRSRSTWTEVVEEMIAGCRGIAKLVFKIEGVDMPRIWAEAAYGGRLVSYPQDSLTDGRGIYSIG